MGIENLDFPLKNRDQERGDDFEKIITSPFFRGRKGEKATGNKTAKNEGGWSALPLLAEDFSGWSGKDDFKAFEADGQVGFFEKIKPQHTFKIGYDATA